MLSASRYNTVLCLFYILMSNLLRVLEPYDSTFQRPCANSLRAVLASTHLTEVKLRTPTRASRAKKASADVDLNVALIPTQPERRTLSCLLH